MKEDAAPSGRPAPRAARLDRRGALRRVAGHAAALAAAALCVGAPDTLRALASPRVLFGPSHPTPRAGVDAARVLTAARLRELGAAAAIPAFDEVRQIPQIADGIRCHCGCADDHAHYSLLSCYEGDGMARECAICTGQGRMAFRLARAGRSLDAIRSAIDDRYG